MIVNFSVILGYIWAKKNLSENTNKKLDISTIFEEMGPLYSKKELKHIKLEIIKMYPDHGQNISFKEATKINMQDVLKFLTSPTFFW